MHPLLLSMVKKKSTRFPKEKLSMLRKAINISDILPILVLVLSFCSDSF